MNNLRQITLASISKDIFQGKWTKGDYDGKLHQENSTLQGQGPEGKCEYGCRLLRYLCCYRISVGCKDLSEKK